MRCNREELLKRLETALKGGRPRKRSGGARREMVDLDDLVVVPSETLPSRDTEIGTGVGIGIDRHSKHGIELDVPLYIADMSYGEVSRSAKAALAYGSALAGSMVMAGNGGLLAEEQEVVEDMDGTMVAKWSRGRHGLDLEYLRFCHGVCIDLSQAPAEIVPSSRATREVADHYDVEKGTSVRQGRTHRDLEDEDDLRHHISLLREALTHEVPIMVKISGGAVYDRTRMAIEAGAEAVVLEGIRAWRARNIDAVAEHAGEPLPGMIPPALRAFIDTKARSRGVRLLVQGGILSGEDAFKALAMGADCVGLDCAALVGIGCKLAGVCHTGRCPHGIATMDPKLEAKLNFKEAGEGLANLMTALVGEMRDLAYCTGLDHLSEVSMKNLRALTHDAASVTGARLVGFDRSLPMWLR